MVTLAILEKIFHSRRTGIKKIRFINSTVLNRIVFLQTPLDT